MSMHHITVYCSVTGRISRNMQISGDSPDELIDFIKSTEQMGVITGAYDPELYYVDVPTKQPVFFPVRPTTNALFDFATKQWGDPRTLETVQAAAWGAMKALRSQKEAAGFTWDGSVFDSDQVSQSRIMGAVQLAVMSPGFEIPWTLQDNTVRTLSASDMMAVGAALGGHVSAIFARAQELRVEIYAATTIAAVEAITWDAP
jgi:hypothetical protein